MIELPARLVAVPADHRVIERLHEELEDYQRDLDAAVTMVLESLRRRRAELENES